MQHLITESHHVKEEENPHGNQSEESKNILLCRKIKHNYNNKYHLAKVRTGE